jgi:hypothetical protein
MPRCGRRGADHHTRGACAPQTAAFPSLGEDLGGRARPSCRRKSWRGNAYAARCGRSAFCGFGTVDLYSASAGPLSHFISHIDVNLPPHMQVSCWSFSLTVLHRTQIHTFERIWRLRLDQHQARSNTPATSTPTIRALVVRLRPSWGSPKTPTRHITMRVRKYAVRRRERSSTVNSWLVFLSHIVVGTLKNPLR